MTLLAMILFVLFCFLCLLLCSCSVFLLFSVLTVCVILFLHLVFIVFVLWSSFVFFFCCAVFLLVSVFVFCAVPPVLVMGGGFRELINGVWEGSWGVLYEVLILMSLVQFSNKEFDALVGDDVGYFLLFRFSVAVFWLCVPVVFCSYCLCYS